jgi:glycosyltransferase involved in cell wall biosynthesis
MSMRRWGRTKVLLGEGVFVHILYMHQHFQTRRGYTGNRSYEFSKCFLRAGHQVTMICSGVENEPQLTVPAGQSYFQTEVDGIHCVPIAAALANPLIVTRLSGYRRMLQFMHFARLATRVGRRLPRPDVVLASHTPLTIGLSGMELARHFDVPFVFEVRDLWPQALINLGVLKNPLAIWWLRRMERKIYRAADHIVALSPGMKAGVVSTGIAEDRVTVIPNASDLDLFRPDLDPGPGRQRLGLGDRFAAIYFGGMGVANGLDYVVEAARVLRERGDGRVVLVLHGNGGQRAHLEEKARQYGLDNVVFSDPVPDKAMVAQLVSACDVCMTIYCATQEHTWSPNKMFDSLSAGKPVLVNVPGWLTDVLEDNQCGRGLSPRHPEQLADALQQLAAHPEQCQRMGANARALAEREFGREQLAGRLASVLEQAIGQRQQSLRAG